MSEAAIVEILEQIDRLSDEERKNLSMMLAEREEHEWQLEAEKARRAAHESGITQAAIDQAVAEIRRKP